MLRYALPWRLPTECRLRCCTLSHPAPSGAAAAGLPAEDPVREAEYNIRRARALWTRAARLAAAGIDRFADSHDALGALELLEEDEAAAGAAAGAEKAAASAED